MITQGIFGSVPWMVLGNVNPYLLLSGFSTWQVATVGFAGLSGIPGAFLGGFISDVLYKKMSYRARPLTAQVSVALGIPCQFLFWYLIKPASEYQTLPVILGILILFNIVAPWPQPGCNFPVLSEIVTGENRNKTICWEMAFENTCATIIANVAVPVVLGFYGIADFKLDADNPKDLPMARTFGIAHTWVVCLPWLVTFVVYSLLHFTFPDDAKNAKGPQEGVELLG